MRGLTVVAWRMENDNGWCIKFCSVFKHLHRETLWKSLQAISRAADPENRTRHRIVSSTSKVISKQDFDFNQSRIVPLCLSWRFPRTARQLNKYSTKFLHLIYIFMCCMTTYISFYITIMCIENTFQYRELQTITSVTSELFAVVSKRGVYKYNR